MRDAPDHLSAVARDKLATTTRQEKRDDLTLDDLPGVLGSHASRRRKAGDRRNHRRGQSWG